VVDALKAPNGAQYFEGSVKGAGLPGGANGVARFKGKLIEATPAKNPKQLKLAITNPEVADVTLVFEEPLAGSAPKGTDLEFEGVGTTFTAEPFNLTMEVENDKLVGWPAQAAPGTKKGTGAGAAKPAGTPPAKPPATKK